MKKSITLCGIIWVCLLLVNLVGCGETNNVITSQEEKEEHIIEPVQEDLHIGQIVNVLDAPCKTPVGIAYQKSYEGSYVWNANYSAGEIYKIDRLKNDVVDSLVIGNHGNCIYGIAFDGTHLYVNSEDDFSGNIIKKIDVTDYSVADTLYLTRYLHDQFPPEVDEENSILNATGLTTDGFSLWTVSYSNGKIYKIDPSKKQYEYVFNAPGNASQGLAFDGQYLWCSDSDSRTIYKLNATDGQVVEAFDAPGLSPRGLSFDGVYLWCADNGSEKIYQLYVGNDPEVEPYTLSGTITSNCYEGDMDAVTVKLGHLYDFTDYTGYYEFPDLVFQNNVNISFIASGHQILTQEFLYDGESHEENIELVEGISPITSVTLQYGSEIQVGSEVYLSAKDNCDNNPVIYYTLDGGDPTLDSNIYSDPIVLSGDTTIKYFAADSNGNTEDVKVEKYVVRIVQVLYVGSDMQGLTYDGQYLWAFDTRQDLLVQIDPEDGLKGRSISLPGTNLRSLAYDGDNIWGFDTNYTNDRFKKISLDDGSVITGLASEIYSRPAIAFGGNELLKIDRESSGGSYEDFITTIDVGTGNRIQRYSVNGVDDFYYIACDSESNVWIYSNHEFIKAFRNYRYNVDYRFSSPLENDIQGITFADGYLWVLSNYRIYKLDITKR